MTPGMPIDLRGHPTIQEAFELVGHGTRQTIVVPNAWLDDWEKQLKEAGCDVRVNPIYGPPQSDTGNGAEMKTLVQRLRELGGSLKEPNIYDDAADRINELENMKCQHVRFNDDGTCKGCSHYESSRDKESPDFGQLDENDPGHIINSDRDA